MRFCNANILCLFIAIFGELAGAQESRTDVTVKAPPANSGGKDFDKVRITVNGSVKTVEPGQTTDFSIAASEGQKLDVQVYAIHKGIFSDDTMQTWKAAIPLSGSGHVNYTASSFGQSIWGQWPLVVFQSDAALFDIILDGTKSLGTIGAGRPNLKKGIEPNQNHTLIWRSSASDICTKEVKLPENVSRTYVCDAKTKQVAEH
jgi:hypothetical protein